MLLFMAIEPDLTLATVLPNILIEPPEKRYGSMSVADAATTALEAEPRT